MMDGIWNRYNLKKYWTDLHVSTCIRSSLGPLRKQIQELFIFQCIVGSQMLDHSGNWRNKHTNI